MLFLWSVLNLLLAVVSSAEELVEQTHVPVLMWSHHLIPALHKYLGKFDNSLELPLSTLFQVVREFTEDCETSAFIFINQPGLRKDDLVEYEEEFVNLERYLRKSSTALAFEQVELMPDDTFEQLTEYVQEICRIDKLLYVEGDNLESFQPYIDIEKRIIRIEYPPLPEDPELRGQAILTFDSNLKKMLAQVPSPAHRVIYTSLEPNTDVLESTGRIFQHIFQDKDREIPIERNNHHLDIPPQFNDYKPKFEGMTGEYLSIFDADFIQENKQLLIAITTSLFGFLILQLVPSRSPTTTGTTKDKNPAEDIKIADKKPLEPPKINLETSDETDSSN
ncbi:hypothetical protein ZYGR_0A02850 [Zygosaccharomyces rouxii]|uniref:Protein BIG1 n=2 Tax=Zygosaccharomyces rouxii TaxID=4956 RepID=C5DPV7_ZYGRC|nr:uncharacterized protein ZYRO0A06490g [Zygosaccharomyces rouxii]GAV46691.1 hypothetical protein ZYGR_0A02850 [Zygosaccharomyces rouxii]CAR25718.1 ZYRO0A06490p [Zygosaccharomyces rouxii]